MHKQLSWDYFDTVKNLENMMILRQRIITFAPFNETDLGMFIRHGHITLKHDIILRICKSCFILLKHTCVTFRFDSHYSEKDQDV